MAFGRPPPHFRVMKGIPALFFRKCICLRIRNVFLLCTGYAAGATKKLDIFDFLDSCNTDADSILNLTVFEIFSTRKTCDSLMSAKERLEKRKYYPTNVPIYTSIHDSTRILKACYMYRYLMCSLSNVNSS